VSRGRCQPGCGVRFQFSLEAVASVGVLTVCDLLSVRQSPVERRLDNTG
jgi:hypothetical protein